MQKKWKICIAIALFSLFIQQFGHHLIKEREADERKAKADIERIEMITGKGMPYPCTALIPECGYYPEMRPGEKAFLQYAFLLPLIGFGLYAYWTRKASKTPEEIEETPKKDTD